jgi:phage terminase large subunit-like protein
MLMFGLRLGDDPRAVVTTTPKPIRIIRELIADPTTVITRGSTYENRANLAPAFIQQIIRKYEGSRLGRQELNAEVLDDMPGALWNRGLIEETRWPAHRNVPDLVRIIIAIDPAVSSGEEADETGIIVAGKDANGHGYVLADQSGRYPPTEWAKVAVRLYHRHNADRIVAEVNNGGDMVESTIRMIDPNVSYSAVRASRGKVVRAEPVAALYEQGRVHHIGAFPTLEDQCCSFTSDFDRKAAGFSPDRVDGLVWAMTELLVEPMAGFAIYELTRQAAERIAAKKAAEAEARKPKLNPAPGSVEYFQMLNRPRE